jgi:prepilin-type N-terminal cleavage/methylation domain-containing protein
LNRQDHQCERATTKRQGFTVIELVITLAIASILMGIAGMSLRPPAERTAANAVQSFIQQARFDSIKSNRPVVISYDSASRVLQASRTDTSTSTACGNAGEAMRTLQLGEYRGVGSPNTNFSVLWLPSGQPRACPAGTAPLDLAQGISFEVSGPSTTVQVVVSAGGEVALR